MRVQTIPDGVLVVIYRQPGHPPVFHLNADLVTEVQAIEFERRINSDPDLAASFGLAS